MRVVEILLPKNIKDKDLSQEKKRQIDFLQRRIDSYVDKILDPKTTNAGREFLKARLKDDYDELKGLLPHIHHIAEESSVQYEVYDRKTGEKVPNRGPYNSKDMARRAVDKLDNAYGAYRYGWRPVHAIKELFDPNNDWQWTFRGSEEKVAEFKVGNIPYKFVAYSTTNGTWYVEFSADLPELKRKGKAHSVTGTGNSNQVFSIVVDIMRDFLKNTPDIKSLVITSEEENRTNLYLRMIKRLMPGYKVNFDGVNTIEVYKNNLINESVNKIPLTDDDFDAIKLMFEKPIPAAVAQIYISEFIDDDEFSDQLKYLEDEDPGRDVRPLIVEWIDRVMPDQMYRFRGIPKSDREGLMSPIHGYDPHMYKGSNDPITGNNAYGSF